MAVLRNYVSQMNHDPSWLKLPVCPAGTFIARVVRIIDTTDVVRPTYNDPSQTEVRDETRFTFAFKHAGQVHLIQSGPMKISCHEQSSLMRILTAMSGSPPRLEEEYRDRVNSVCQITVTHAPGKNGQIYSRISSVAPVHVGLVAHAPGVEEGEQLYRYFEQQMRLGGTGATGNQRPLSVVAALEVGTPMQVHTPGSIPASQQAPRNEAQPQPNVRRTAKSNPPVVASSSPTRAGGSQEQDAPPPVNYVGPIPQQTSTPQPPPQPASGYTPNPDEPIDVGF